MTTDFKEFGSYRIGVNLPVGQAPVWEKVARAARWGAPVVEINDQVERMGNKALHVLKELAQVNELKYTMHIPPSAEQSGELALPDERSNKFAREVFTQALKAAAKVGAKHITFHPTHQVPRPQKDTVYIYNELTKSVGAQRVPPGFEDKKDEFIKMLNESQKAELDTRINRLKSDLSLLKGLEQTAEIIEKRGVSTKDALDLALLTHEANRTGSMIGVRPPDIGEWAVIQEKVKRFEKLTPQEEKFVQDFAKRVRQQVKNYKTSIENSLKQIEMFKDKDVIKNGIEVMRDNIAKNIAALPKDVLQQAMSKGVSIGIENLPGQFLFSTPEELKDVRKRIVDNLVKKGFSRSAAENFVGFTFDFAHAITAKHFEAGGKKYSVPEFVQELGPGEVKHIHAVDAIGTIDAHLPLGHGELTKEEIEKVEQAVKKSGLTAVHELGPAGIPQLYHESLRFYEGGMYSVGEVPTSSLWGPTYLAASMVDPITMQKEGGYFYDSFVDLF